jgi:hypothetical protein
MNATRELYGFERLEACLSTGTFRIVQAARDAILQMSSVLQEL